MCYSAQAWQDYRKYTREFGSTLAIDEYIRLFWSQRKAGNLSKFPKAMLDAFAGETTGEPPRLSRRLIPLRGLSNEKVS